MLQIVLRNEMAERGLSSHAAADAIGVSHTTILRALRGDTVDVETIVKIANFLKVRPSELLDTLDGSQSSLAEQLAVLLSHSRELEKQLQNAVQKVKDGDMDLHTLRDVIAYAMFKFQTSGDSDDVPDTSAAKRGRRKGKPTRVA